MLGAALKGLGVVVLVGGAVGMVAGGVLFLFGGPEGDGSGEASILADGKPAGDGRGSTETGAAVFGSSLMVAGVGLIVLVAGIVAGSRTTGQQRQQVVAASRDATNPPRMGQ